MNMTTNCVSASIDEIPQVTAAVEGKNVTAKALQLANADYAVNGNYINAPYTVCSQGEMYKAHIRDGKSGQHLEIVRPAKTVAIQSLRPNHKL